MNKIDAYCKCGCGNGIVIMRFATDGDDVYVSTVISGFHAKQCGIFETIRRRVKAAWFILRGKEFYLHDMILGKHEWNEFVKSVNGISFLEENNMEET